MKADKDLLRRVIVALESGRDVDVNTLLQSELAPVLKSLATLDGSLREVGKSDLDQRIGNWERFIILEDNKASLAHFLSTEISESYRAPPGRERVINGGFKDTLKVWSSDTSRQDIRELASDHEEADTRIVLNARDAAARGYKQVVS
ncbi:unnamed protein product [Porites evermanni]|uniref:Uncharacterized protein n=1 Tax=Porites evermanni TaxID=104178 RepID=A0ABN8RF67_9CNID|nr:unnamed protein product [Porites evermanni]